MLITKFSLVAIRVKIRSFIHCVHMLFISNQIQTWHICFTVSSRLDIPQDASLILSRSQTFPRLLLLEKPNSFFFPFSFLAFPFSLQTTSVHFFFDFASCYFTRTPNFPCNRTPLPRHSSFIAFFPMQLPAFLLTLSLE